MHFVLISSIGRILRAKRRNEEGFRAYFYTLVSMHTREVDFNEKRKQFLIDQGYAYKVVQTLEGLESTPGLALTTTEAQDALLEQVKAWKVGGPIGDAGGAARARAVKRPPVQRHPLFARREMERTKRRKEMDAAAGNVRSG